jgi:hypothetical protein
VSESESRLSARRRGPGEDSVVAAAIADQNADGKMRAIGRIAAEAVYPSDSPSPGRDLKRLDSIRSLGIVSGQQRGAAVNGDHPVPVLWPRVDRGRRDLTGTSSAPPGLNPLAEAITLSRDVCFGVAE